MIAFPIAMSESSPICVAYSHTMRGISTIQDLHADPGQSFGSNKKGEPANAAMRCVEISAAMRKEYKGLQHFVLYAIEDDDIIIDRTPRLHKVVLPQLRREGGEVWMAGIGMDWDLKDLFQRPKEECAWSVLSRADTKYAQDILFKGLNGLEESGFPWNVFYTTPHGIRMVHVFPEQMPAGLAYEATAADLRRHYLHHGIEVDESCKDWVRMFKCPRITLDDDEETKTWEQDWFVCHEQWENYMEMPDYDDEEMEVLHIDPLSGDCPLPSEADELITFMNDKGKFVPTIDAKKAKRALSRGDSRFFDVIFQEKLLAGPGERHTKVLELVGSVLHDLHGYDYVTPEFVFSLLVGPVRRIGGEDDHVAQLWENIQSIWVTEEAKLSAAREEIVVKEGELEERTLNNRETLLQGVRTWLPDIEDMSDPEAIEFLREGSYGVIRSQRRDTFQVLMPNGYYQTAPCSLSAMRARIIEANMDWLVPVEFTVEDDKGNPITKALKPERIRDDFSRTFANESLNLRHRGCYLEIDETNGEGTFHTVPFALRSDIEPEFNEEVHEWLIRLVDDEILDDFLCAIAYSLAITDGPTAALSISGPPGTGKTLIALGLSECFTSLEACPGDALVARFNSSLLTSPIVWIDEGISKGLYDFADQFRKVVTGGALPVERKGGEILKIAGVHRIILTANNDKLLLKAAGGEARTEQDLAAIATRLAHFEVNQDAADYLLYDLGGLKGTHGWIVGESGEASSFIVARHFLWLYHNHIKWSNGKIERANRRLLFEGKCDAIAIREVEAEAGVTPEVVMSINSLLRSKKNPIAIYSKGCVHLLKQKVVDYLCEQRGHHKGQDFKLALTALLDADQKTHPYKVNGRTGRWKTIGGERFKRIMLQHGDLSSAIGDEDTRCELEPERECEYDKELVEELKPDSKYKRTKR